MAEAARLLDRGGEFVLLVDSQELYDGLLALRLVVLCRKASLYFQAWREICKVEL